ncbi:alpha/beta hydrolase [Actinocorallia sp. A-T 12471]|uniref:alpha/beta hydrolase n=1 Tax=Actinocorallia sp. A-T 12471 TaxID=3089813 RepID=UPI0029CFB189|nr:alpha/beta hydrolase [Actinocorallia sp. A-T 12471]MDX6741388.1 alpha/beta hydrolase [Actinocorallia sp. A-T 12471]
MSELPVRLHDGSTITATVRGSGPAVLLPVRTEPHDAPTAAAMRAWGADPDLGAALAAALAADFTVVTADYEGHRMGVPAPETLTPGNLAADLLAVADAAGADRFAYYGYSWLALAGLQLAVRTDRLWALAMGGYPPADGPYAAMLDVTRAAHAKALAPSGSVPDATPGDWDAVQPTAAPETTRQFVTLYEALQDFDDTAAIRALTLPRLAFAGASDDIVYGPGWGDTTVRIASALAARRADLTAQGWTVALLEGLDHMSAMRSEHVLPVLHPWLTAHAPR